jgi:molybdopterin synthase catalytic subunit
MPQSRVALVEGPLSVETLVAGLEGDLRRVGEGCGAVCTFVGVVRGTHEGRRVQHLDYEAYEPLARRAMEIIAGEVAEEWPSGLVAIHHRVGRLQVGEASVVVAAAAAHRADAFRICRYAIERVKQIVPIWKHEFFEDGEAWVDGSTAAPDDRAARQQARDRACA